MKKTLLLAALGCLLFHCSAFAQLTWQRIPGPPGGTGKVVLGTAGHWLLHNSSTGIQETSDGGKNWRWHALPGSIHTEAALHIGTDGRIWFFDREELTASTDNGKTWQIVFEEGSKWVDQDFTATLILEKGAVMLGTSAAGIVRSTDSSKTLTTVLPLAGGLNALARNRQNGHLYAWKTAPAAGQINKIYRSTNDGLTWAAWQNDPAFTGRTIHEIAFAPNGSVFVGTDQKGLRSTDDGATWTPLTVKINDNRQPNIGILPSGRLLISNEDAAIGGSTQFSDDNGDTWHPNPIDGFRNFSVMPDGTLFAEYQFSGFYQSQDEGLTWQYASFGMNHHVWPVSMYFNPDQSMLAVTGQGIFYSPNAATDWKLRHSVLADSSVESFSLVSAMLSDGSLFCFFQQKLWRSTDRALTWTDVTSPAYSPDKNFNTLREVDDVLFFSFGSGSGSDQMLRSADGGATWQDLGNQQLNRPEMTPDGTFWAFNYGSTLQKSTDRGITWSNVVTPSLSGPLYIHAMPNGTLLLMGYGKMYRSTNGGGTWTTTNQTYMNSVSTAFSNSAGHLFVVGSQSGSAVFLLSVDGGNTFQFVNSPNSYWASDFIFQAPDERIWFASGDGVWRSTEPSTDFLTIGGTVRNDLNQNCVAAFAEPALPNFLVKTVASNGQAAYGMSDATGYYRALAKGGTYQVSAVVPNDLWETCSVTANIPANITNGNFNAPTLPVKPAVLCPRLEIDVAAPLLRRCFETKLAVAFHNSGTAPAPNARVEVVLDPFLDVLNTSLPIATQSGDTLFFNLGTVKVNEKGTFFIEIKVSCDAALSQMHCTSARISPDSICSGWKGAVLRTAMTCLGDSVLLEIKNTGASDMAMPQKWQVWRNIWTNFDSSLVAEGNFFLTAGEVFSQKIAAETSSNTLFFKAPQELGYPFGSGYAQSVLLHCDGGGNPPYTYEYQAYEPSRSIFCLRNIGSFDPNDKTGFPEGIGAGHHIEKTEPLRYLIRFQNTGTDTAFTVVIRDTLSPLLDIETLQIGASSHPMTANVRGENELVFRFDNILLPDSNINEAASHGFVQYSIRQKPNNPEGSVIRNRAGIYFDFNLPVMTNETWHTVGLPKLSGVWAVQNDKPLSLVVSPNPFSEQFWVAVPAFRFAENCVLEISDPAGRVLRRQNFGSEKTTIERGDLPSGLLFLTLKNAAGAVLASGRAVAVDSKN